MKKKKHIFLRTMLVILITGGTRSVFAWQEDIPIELTRNDRMDKRRGMARSLKVPIGYLPFFHAAGHLPAFFRRNSSRCSCDLLPKTCYWDTFASAASAFYEKGRVWPHYRSENLVKVVIPDNINEAVDADGNSLLMKGGIAPSKMVENVEVGFLYLDQKRGILIHDKHVIPGFSQQETRKNLSLYASGPFQGSFGHQHTHALIDVLLAKGALVNKQNFKGETILMHALSDYQPDVIPLVRKLLIAGANPHITDKTGESALDKLEQQVKCAEKYKDSFKHAPDDITKLTSMCLNPEEAFEEASEQDKKLFARLFPGREFRYIPHQYVSRR